MCQLTRPRVCAVDLRLCGVSEDDGSYTIEAVLFSVLLQSCLLQTHHVVLAITSAHNQLRDTKLLLQYWDSRAVTFRRKNNGKNKHFSYFLINILSDKKVAFTISIPEEEALPLFRRRADSLLKVG